MAMHTQAAKHNQERFLNLLPFHNRMPRNEFYASQTCKVVAGCMRPWSNWLGSKPNSRNPGIFDDRCLTHLTPSLTKLLPFPAHHL